MLRHLLFASLCWLSAETCCGASPKNFRVTNGKIYDPQGRLFSAAGVNLRDPSSAQQVLSLLPGINFVRVALGGGSVCVGRVHRDDDRA